VRRRDVQEFNVADDVEVRPERADVLVGVTIAVEDEADEAVVPERQDVRVR
jgi:hypothetical protein